MSAPPPMAPARTLFNFRTPDNDAWRVVNDTVMGGRSRSHVAWTEAEGLRFAGHLSLDDGGGFASMHAPLAIDLGPFDGLALQARGDGRRYWLTARTEAGGSISYRASFQPSDPWRTHTIRFEALSPHRRGRAVPDAPPFDPAAITRMGVLLADEQAGDFWMALRWIRAV